MTMTYEAYLDEVTTLIVEKYNVSDAAAIKMVVAAQDKEFFVRHDENAALRTEDQAHKDAKTIFSAAPSRPAAGAKPARPSSTAKPAASSTRARPAPAGQDGRPAVPGQGGKPGKPRR